MIAVSCRFAHSFNIIYMRHPIVLVRALPDPVRVIYSGSNDTIEQVSYIVCLNGRVPKMYELCSLNFQEFVRFICMLKFDSLTILEKILSRLSSSIRGDTVFLSLVG